MAPLAGKTRYLEMLAALFIMTLIVSNIASVKLVQIGSLVFDAGTILFPLAYILGDVITEIYGFRRMRRLLYIGVGTLIITMFILWVVQHLPAAADWGHQAAYDATLGVAWRIVCASVIAIFVGELINAYVLARMKVKTKGRHLWTRLIGSSAVGSAIDTVIFSVIAFAGTISSGTLLVLILTVYGIKMATDIIVSPITMRVIAYLKKSEKIDVYEVPRLT